MANKVLEKGGIDYVTVFQDEEIFRDFASLTDPFAERSGFTYEPIEIQVRLQLKSMNAVDLDEEFLDVTVFMTFEWTDPNLAWTVKEREQATNKVDLQVPTNPNEDHEDDRDNGNIIPEEVNPQGRSRLNW